MGVNDERDCPLCSAETNVNEYDSQAIRRCTDCNWYVEISGGTGT